MTNSASTERLDSSYVRYQVLAAFCLLALIAYIQRNSIGVAEADIRQELGLTKSQMGWVMSCFFFTYALFQLPTGYIGQRWGTRRALSLFTACCSLATGIFALAFQPWLLVSARGAMGVTQAGLFPCAVNSIAKWMPESRRSFSTGMLGSFMSVGGAVGVALTGVLLSTYSWRVILIVYSIPGLIFSIWFYRWFRDQPSEHPSTNAAEIELLASSTVLEQVDLPDPTSAHRAGSEVGADVSWHKLFVTLPMIALCGQQLFRAAGAMFFASWFSTYLRETREVDVSTAGLLTSLPLLAIVFGSAVGGTLSDWILRRTGSLNLSRRGLGASSMLACAILVLVSFKFAHPTIAVLLISCGSFCAAFAGPCAYSSTIDMGGKRVPVVFATMNMVGNFGAFLFPIIVPLLLNESELYVSCVRLSTKSTDAPIVFPLANASNTNAELIEKFGAAEASVARFHHGKNQERTLFAEFTLTTTIVDGWTLEVEHTGHNPPPMRFQLNDKPLGQLDLSSAPPGELVWTKSDGVPLPPGEHKLRILTTTRASGNWNLVLFSFALIYVAACICWMFVDTEALMDSSGMSDYDSKR